MAHESSAHAATRNHLTFVSSKISAHLMRTESHAKWFVMDHNQQHSTQHTTRWLRYKYVAVMNLWPCWPHPTLDKHFCAWFITFCNKKKTEKITTTELNSITDSQSQTQSTNFISRRRKKQQHQHQRPVFTLPTSQFVWALWIDHEINQTLMFFFSENSYAAFCTFVYYVGHENKFA